MSKTEAQALVPCRKISGPDKHNELAPKKDLVSHKQTIPGGVDEADTSERLEDAQAIEAQDTDYDKVG